MPKQTTPAIKAKVMHGPLPAPLSGAPQDTKTTSEGATKAPAGEIAAPSTAGPLEGTTKAAGAIVGPVVDASYWGWHDATTNPHDTTLGSGTTQAG